VSASSEEASGAEGNWPIQPIKVAGCTVYVTFCSGSFGRLFKIVSVYVAVVYSLYLFSYLASGAIVLL
jgi:hypothetical protein